MRRRDTPDRTTPGDAATLSPRTRPGVVQRTVERQLGMVLSDDKLVSLGIWLGCIVAAGVFVGVLLATHGWGGAQ